MAINTTDLIKGVPDWNQIINENNAILSNGIDNNSNKIGDLTGNGLTETDLATAIKNDRSQLSKMTQQIGKKSFFRQPKTFFGWTGTKLIEPSNEFDAMKCGEPVVVWDNDNDIWRMFYFGYISSGNGYCLSATSHDLKTWTKTGVNLSAEGRTDRHKISILVDTLGTPVKIDGKYHGYIVSTATSKTIYHWETDNLANVWTETGAVIAPNFANNGTDDYKVDAPCAIYDDINKKIILFYMGMPATSQADCEYGHRTNRAVSDSTSSGFVYDGEVLKPASASNLWWHGWIGGIQILKIEKGYLVAFNAGGIRPAKGAEGNSSAGFGFMETLYSPIKPVDTPTLQIQSDLSGLTGYSDVSSVWRPFLVFDKFSNSYICFYNTGLASTSEWITYAKEGVLHMYNNANNAWNIMTLPNTGVSTNIPNSQMVLPPGKYRITVSCLPEQGSTVTNHLVVHLLLTFNGVTFCDRAVNIGNYAGEYHALLAQGYTDTTTQNAVFVPQIRVTEGTHVDTAKLSYIDIIIESV